MDKQHHYQVRVVWTGNQGTGTSLYQGYARAHDIIAPGKPTIPGSADPAFRGDPTRWNPEDLLLAAIAACHKLWYLGLCAQGGVNVTAYEDNAEALMIEHPNGAGEFRSITL
jgi:organic hydroperoxide reductase OsmC/OhrA